MATIDKIFTNIIGTSGSKTTVAASSSTTSTVVLELDMKRSLHIGCSVTYGSSPDANVTVDVLTSPDGTNYDTTAFDTFDVAQGTAGQTLQRGTSVAVDPRYIKVKVTNNSATDSVTVWVYSIETQRF